MTAAVRRRGGAAIATTEVSGDRQFPCPNCGGELAWQPARQTLVCTSCGTAHAGEPLPPTPPCFIAHALDESLSVVAEARDGAEHVAVRCTSCHAVAYFDRRIAADRCPYCGSAAVVSDIVRDRFQPESILPFQVDAPAAREAATRWIRRAWLAPSKLKRLARTDIVKGVYLPFWMFDAHTIAHWDSANGARGNIEMDFDDLLVCADRDADPQLLERVEPYPAKALRAYDPRYVAGWTVARAERSLDEAATLAHARMGRDLAAAAKRNRTAKERDKLRIAHVEYVRETCKQTLLPVWLLDYVYLGRRYRIAINGANGNTAGNAPTSVFKLAVLTILACWVFVFVQDPETALRIPVSMGERLWWLVRWPFGELGRWRSS